MSLANLFRACERLEAFVFEQFPRTGLVLGSRDNRMVIWGTVFRGLKTVDALLLLARRWYGDQALMLSRSLFEDTVVALWVASDPDEDLLELMKSHEKSVAAVLQEDRPGRRYFEAVARIPPLSAAEIERFVEEQDIDRRRARKQWTGLNVRQMLEVARRDGVDTDWELLDRLYEVGYLLQNVILHHSPAALSATLKTRHQRGPGAMGFSRRPSRQLVQDSLSVAYHCLALMARLVARPASTARLDEILTEDLPKFVVLTPDQLKVGRNDRCPCESGLKFKQCHGRRSPWRRLVALR